jgi:protein-L-isoaspartate(D-aspartate) O-methyltransferase
LGETVVALESDPTLVKRAETILAELHVDNAVVIEGPLRDGAAKHGPFDVIIIDGQVPEVPRHLLSQLSENGRLLTFVGTPVSGHAVLVEYRSGAASDRNLFDAVAPRLAEFETESQFEF